MTKTLEFHIGGTPKYLGDRDNKEAGHKWSSGDWRKFVEAELMELKGESDKESK